MLHFTARSELQRHIDETRKIRGQAWANFFGAIFHRH